MRMVVRRLRQWLVANRVILTNSGSMVGASFITSMLGFAYWWLAALLFPATAVGLAAIAAAMMQLLAQFGVLGFGTLLSGELRRRPNRRAALVTSVLFVTSLSTGALGILFVLIVPHFLRSLQPLAANASSAILFALGVSITGISLILDSAMVGMLRAHLSLWRNTILAVSKLIILFALGRNLASAGWLTIYGAWAASVVVSCIGLLLLLRPKLSWWRGLYPQWRLIQGLGRVALGHHLLNQALSIASIGLPLIVTALLSVATNAYFNISWQIAGFASLALTSITAVLFVIGAEDQAALARKVRATIPLSLVVGILSSGALFIGARFVLTIYPPEYAQHATWCLRIFSLSIFPLIIRTHYVTIRRIEGRAIRAGLLLAAGGGLELLLAAIGAHYADLTGLSIGWLAALCVEAMLMVRKVYRVATAVVPGVANQISAA